MQNSSRIFFILIPLLFIFFSGCKKDFSQYDNLYVLDTVMSISLENDASYQPDDVVRKVLDEIRRLDNIFNVHKTGSEAFRLNQTAYHTDVLVSDELLELIKISLHYAEISGGAFDPALLSMKKIWNFTGERLTRVPEKKEILQALKKTGYRYIRIFGNKIRFLKKGLGIDLGGIAKGYIVDKVISVMKQSGVKNALLNVGGDVFALGKKKAVNWKIGIQHPRDNDKLVTLLSAANVSVVTSGDYERFAIINGKRYHHIIDPSTGYPADKCISVTVVAEKSVTADVLSTTFFVLGAEKSLELVKKLKNVEILIVTMHQGKLKIWRSQGFDRYKDSANPG